MANRRMFSKDVVTSRQFLEMPSSSRALYYQLGVEADDDGFIDPYITMLATGSKIDDLKVLRAKEFVIEFEDGVLVITDWKRNNMIRKDTYNPTQYKGHFKKLGENEIKKYELSYSDGDVPAPQDSIGKDSIDNIYTEILNHWNNKSSTSFKGKKKKFTLTQHKLKGITGDKIKQKIRRLHKSEITVEQINNAIDNYFEILVGAEYYWNYQWSLPDFLMRGYDKFEDLDRAKSNFAINKGFANSNSNKSFESEDLTKYDRAN